MQWLRLKGCHVACDEWTSGEICSLQHMWVTGSVMWAAASDESLKFGVQGATATNWFPRVNGARDNGIWLYHHCHVFCSERVDASGATGQRLKEGGSINKSLVCLGKIISTLGKFLRYLHKSTICCLQISWHCFEFHFLLYSYLLCIFYVIFYTVVISFVYERDDSFVFLEWTKKCCVVEMILS